MSSVALCSGVFTRMTDDVAIGEESAVTAHVDFYEFYRHNYARVLRIAFAVTGEREPAAKVSQWVLPDPSSALGHDRSVRPAGPVGEPGREVHPV